MQRDLNDIVVFATVVQAGSFTSAAKQLALPTSSVSRRVSRLERQLETRLLQRTTRALHLTDAGRAYFERAARVTTELELAERALAELKGQPAGRLRLTAPADIDGRLFDILLEFMRCYPQVNLDLRLTQRVVNLVEEGFDCAIRAGHLPDSRLIARRLVSSEGVHVYASPAYIERRGAPRELADVNEHDIIAYSGEDWPLQWQLVAGKGRRTIAIEPMARVNDFGAIRHLVLAGGGLAMLPELLCRSDVAAGRLVQVLPAVGRKGDAVWFVYPSRVHISPTVAALGEFLKSRFTEMFRPAGGGA